MLIRKCHILYSTFRLTEYRSYKEKNKDEPGFEQKIEDLVTFIKGAKFGMMTTKNVDSGLLVSRCMALAATVSAPHRQTGLGTS
jgi:hypothetical protein